MAEWEYRIDFTDIGFGSTNARGAVDDAAGVVGAIIQNRLWETQPGMPDPSETPR
jgi:hypothetical protein